MIKIALFIRSFKIGGAEKQSVLIAEYLQKYYDTYLVVYHFTGAYTEFAKNKKLKLIPMKYSGILKVIYFIFILFKLHPYLLISFLPVNNILGGLLFKLVGAKHFIGGIRGAKIKKSRIKMSLSKYICNKRSTFFLSNSEAGKMAYASYGYDKNKIIVIPNCIEIRKNLKQKKTNGEITILSVGRLIDEKDYMTAINAMGMMAGNDPEIRFNYHIVGYGELYDEIKRGIAARGLEHRTVIHKDIDYKGVESFYEKADIYLITSRFEGMPNTVMEALDNYLPVVGTKAGDIEKLILHGKNGYLSEIGDAGTIYTYIKALSIDAHIREKFGNYGKSHLAMNFAVDVIGKKYVDLIDAIS